MSEDLTADEWSERWHECHAELARLRKENEDLRLRHSAYARLRDIEKAARVFLDVEAQPPWEPGESAAIDVLREALADVDRVSGGTAWVSADRVKVREP